jgi:hypothetical protein
VTPKITGTVFVRLPSWADRDTVAGEGIRNAPASNGYLVFPEAAAARPIVIDLPMPERSIVLKHRTREIRMKLRGDAVTAMENFGADLTFFEPL